MSTIAFHTFGCKLNFAETSGISRGLNPKSYAIIDFSSVADIYVIHSCTVTANAERKTIAAIRQAHRRNPEAKIIVIGCMAELQRERLLKEKGVHLILGNEEKFDLETFLEEIKRPEENIQAGTFFPSWSVHERTRSFLKIQDGCDYFCAYCTIPLARGRSRSGSITDILVAAKEIAASGVKEIVLTGVNIGDFGRHQGESLFQLLEALEAVEGLERMRISSIEPDLLSEGIIKMAAGKGKLLPHFHVPLQSGSDQVLRLMKRKYNTRLFAEKMELIKKLIPQACIATDVIVGFPGESAELFDETYRFIESLPLSYLHVFTYSERKNTPAGKSLAIVHPSERKERSLKLHLLSEKKKAIFYESQSGQTFNVFFESDNKNGFLFGWTENYIKVRYPFRQELVNCIVAARLTKLHNKDFFDCELL